MTNPNTSADNTSVGKSRESKPRQPNGASSVFLGNDGRWHGYVTVGVKDNGKPDRRHVSSRSRAETVEKVRKLEKARDAGQVRKAGKPLTLEAWLTRWTGELLPLAVDNGLLSENTVAGYEVAVRVHLIPRLGAHRLTRLEPVHLERCYAAMIKAGSAPATANQAHRTLRVALGEAVRHGLLTDNVAKNAKPPQPGEHEVEPYTVEEIQQILLMAAKGRNAARWVIALALGLRQGEVLGLMWTDIDLDTGILYVRRSRLRPKYAHGCGDTCGRKPGYCPQRVQARRETKDTKSRAGRRAIGLPDELLKLLVRHRELQDTERETARQMWTETGYVFTSPTGAPLNPNTDYHRWKELLTEAGVREAALHDARHTAATVLLLLGVAQRVVMQIMGWSSASMAKRYQHVVDPLLHATAEKVNDLLWGP
ncbi:tyrosine-type recombinase/integrase [Yinghuangia sp. YIM S10712]|uniref:tyrosine-type recombinase/integrase n=1 Tax=Yinghuangia sp. YIM S10712 TaxID=3436930 RepID=UPI003F52DA51